MDCVCQWLNDNLKCIFIFEILCGKNDGGIPISKNNYGGGATRKRTITSEIFKIII